MTFDSAFIAIADGTKYLYAFYVWRVEPSVTVLLERHQPLEFPPFLCHCYIAQHSLLKYPMFHLSFNMRSLTKIQSIYPSNSVCGCIIEHMYIECVCVISMPYVTSACECTLTSAYSCGLLQQSPQPRVPTAGKTNQCNTSS